MDEYDHRRRQLKKWVAVNGTPAKEKSYFSQLLGGDAPFGEKAAKRLEEQYGMGRGFLDSDSEPAANEVRMRTAREITIVKGWTKEGRIMDREPAGWRDLRSDQKAAIQNIIDLVLAGLVQLPNTKNPHPDDDIQGEG